MSGKHFSKMTYEEQQEFIRDARARRQVVIPPIEGVSCSGCRRDLTSQKCLRASFAPPDKAWSARRFCDLVCLLDFLDDEEEKGGAGEIFTSPELVDRDLAVPVRRATGS